MEDESRRAVQIVESVTLDDVKAGKLSLSHSHILKLDVEGAEVAALDGSLQTFATRHAAAIVEPHGSDRSSGAPSWGLRQGQSIFHVDDDGRVMPIESEADALYFKVDPKRGYNFVMYRLDPGCTLSQRFEY